MLQQLVLIVIALLYLQKKSVSSLTYEHVAFLLLLAYLMRQSFRVEHLSAADGFTTDIDKEAYTNLHKIVSELYKNDTLTIPGHVHIQGNLQVGDKGGVTGNSGNQKQGGIYGQYTRSRHVGPNEQIDGKHIDIHSGEKCTIHPHIHCNSIEANKKIYSGDEIHAQQVHAWKVKTNELQDRNGGWVYHKSSSRFDKRVNMPQVKDNEGPTHKVHGELYRRKNEFDLRIWK